MRTYKPALLKISALALVLMAFAVACGGDDDDTSGATTPTATTVAAGVDDKATPNPTAAGDGSETPEAFAGDDPDDDEGVLRNGGYIGTATMDQGGTIHLILRAENPDGNVVEGFLDYPPDHPDYQDILDHIGDIEPGDTVDVLPFD